MNVGLSLEDLAKPYFLKANNNPSNTLVILVHGFGASCTETLPLAKHLNSIGYDTLGVLLSGHGTSPEDLDHTKWENWIVDIQTAYETYKDEYKHIFIGGVSLGGALVLYMASMLDVTGVFTINAFYKMKLIHRLVIPLLSLFKVHISRSASRVEWYKEHQLFAYPVDVSHAANEILKLHRRLYRRIQDIKVPTLLIQSKTDHTIDPNNANLIYKNLTTSYKKLIWISDGDHILTVDKNAIIAFDAISNFINDTIQIK